MDTSGEFEEDFSKLLHDPQVLIFFSQLLIALFQTASLANLPFRQIEIESQGYNNSGDRKGNADFILRTDSEVFVFGGQMGRPFVGDVRVGKKNCLQNLSKLVFFFPQ